VSKADGKVPWTEDEVLSHLAGLYNDIMCARSQERIQKSFYSAHDVMYWYQKGAYGLDVVAHFHMDFKCNVLPDFPIEEWSKYDPPMRDILSFAPLLQPAVQTQQREVTPNQEVLPPPPRLLR
jgi:hypothetical protein